ncbi:RHS repeat-associated core domain-containing protein [Nocardia sp. NPDC052001]|uniref:RHS repeat-associated core domain-containing protein n=1 Tax=Nocardia sp. NPDC052001 TaxID=3154853 RepID=UPI003428520E
MTEPARAGLSGNGAERPTNLAAGQHERPAAERPSAETGRGAGPHEQSPVAHEVAKPLEPTHEPNPSGKEPNSGQPERNSPRDNTDSGKPATEHDGKPTSEHEGKPNAEREGKPNAEREGKPNAEHEGKPNGEHEGKPAPEHNGEPPAEHPGRESQPEEHSPAERAASDATQLSEGTNQEVANTQNAEDVNGCQDPVDAATGEFFVPETDLELPGVLPLILVRRHRSNYRLGRWFGPSWSATLDTRLVVTDHAVTLLGEDGLVLTYPHPVTDQPTAPHSTALRWSLTRTESGGYRIWNPDREVFLHFAPDPSMGGLDTALGNFALTAFTDRHNNHIRFHYDADGNPTEITHSGGYRVRVTTDSGRITSLAVIDTKAGTTIPVKHFAYTAGELTAATNCHNGTTHYTYDPAHRMLSWTDSNTNSMHNTYDAAGRIIRQVGTADMMSCTFAYATQPDGTSVTTVTNSQGAQTHRTFDTDLRLRELVTPDGAHTRFDYNTDRNPLRVIAPDGATTHYSYTPYGDVSGITRPDGATLTLEYPTYHRPTRIVDVDGTVRQREWDAIGNLSAEVDPLGARTEYTHHPNGSVATITEPTGARTTVEVDAAGLPTLIIDASGAQTRFNRDAFGRVIHSTNPLGATAIATWTPDGKPLSQTDPNGNAESWTYDGEANILIHTNPAGGRTTYRYGAFDLLAARTDPAGATTAYTHDTELRPTTVTNPNGQTWRYAYNLAGQLVTETDYTGAATGYTYDLAGRAATVTPATGIARHNTYDILGRLTAVTADSGDWIHYAHDPAGRLLTAVNGNAANTTHTLRFSHTPTGQLATQQLDDQHPMVLTLDRFGRRVGRTLPSGAETRWHYDHLGLTSGMIADGHDLAFTHDAVGRLTRWQTGELAVDRAYDPAGLVIRNDVSANPGALLNLGPEPARILRSDKYSWRPDGYITAHTTLHLNAGPTDRRYDLDPLGRVETLTRNDTVAEQYTYDPLSNILSSRTPSPESAAAGIATSDTSSAPTDPHTSGNREYRDNLLIRDGRTRYHYDAAGRLIRKTRTRLSRKPDIWHFHYNAFDQLTDVSTPDGQCWHYTYDALGRRTSKRRVSSDGTVDERANYTWDSTYLVEQATAGATTRWHYQPTSRVPITQTTDRAADRAFYAIISDVVGTPVELVDPDSAEIVSTATTELWGTTSWRGNADTPLRFPGQIHDPETGLYYNLHRTYDPVTGRFLTQDPLGLAPAPNPNAYPHNPTAWTDPLGLVPVGCSGFGNQYRPGIEPELVKFSQKTASSHFSNGMTIEHVASGLRSGWLNPADFPPIRLVARGGDLFTLDNRRLIAFQKAGMTVPFRMATVEEALGEAWKFTTQTGGESILVRQTEEVWSRK